jgi:hypothetical protein
LAVAVDRVSARIAGALDGAAEGEIIELRHQRA